MRVNLDLCTTSESAEWHFGFKYASITFKNWLSIGKSHLIPNKWDWPFFFEFCIFFTSGKPSDANRWRTAESPIDFTIWQADSYFARQNDVT